jgi:site-specific recombinase XerC
VTPCTVKCCHNVLCGGHISQSSALFCAQGTRSSKKKKQHKLKRVMATVKKSNKKSANSHHESFAAMHLLHDPQVGAAQPLLRRTSILSTTVFVKAKM